MNTESDFVRLKSRLFKVEAASIQAAAALLEISILLQNLRSQHPELTKAIEGPAENLQTRIQNMINKLDEAGHVDD